MWRRDSIRSNKYKDIVNTIFNGRLSEIKMKGYNGKIIPNPWWEMVWREVIVPNNIHSEAAKEVFEQVITSDHNSLDVEKLYEELSKRLMPTGDALRQGNGTMSTPKVPSSPMAPNSQKPATPPTQGGNVVP